VDLSKCNVRKDRQYFKLDQTQCPLAVQYVYATEQFAKLAEIFNHK
jgi:hypothetical protein